MNIIDKLQTKNIEQFLTMFGVGDWTINDGKIDVVGSVNISNDTLEKYQ